MFVDKGKGFEMVGVTAVLGAVAGTLLLFLGVLDRLGLLDSSGGLFFSRDHGTTALQYTRFFCIDLHILFLFTRKLGVIILQSCWSK